MGKVMSLMSSMLSRFVIAFLPKSKHLLMPWLQSPSTVILEPKKIKSVTVSTFLPSICHEAMRRAWMIISKLLPWAGLLWIGGSWGAALAGLRDAGADRGRGRSATGLWWRPHLTQGVLSQEALQTQPEPRPGGQSFTFKC